MTTEKNNLDQKASQKNIWIKAWIKVKYTTFFKIVFYSNFIESYIFIVSILYISLFYISYRLFHIMQSLSTLLTWTKLHDY